ncbi:hypothetical protein [Microlunatus ginsengisoli]|uniref:DUF559 domain-containing protein n=1 Tax=Microlunatus ginsengisoli TaxID=363863 RepID=A0ABP6ZAA8_9ACTN
MTLSLDETPRIVTGSLRRAGWDKLGRGLYAAGDRTLAEELAAWSRVLGTTAAFTHLTATELRGWWLPAPIPHPVFVATSLREHHRRPGLFACRHPHPGPIELLDGLRVTTAAETLLACARDLGLLDVVVLGDSALRLRQCTIAELRLVAARRRRGAPLLRTAIPLLDARSESPWESVMRVLHRAAGVDVVPQREIHTDAGAFVARGDLWLVGTKRIHEYDGEIHRAPDVHRSDLERDRRIVRAGWQRLGFTSRDLLHDGASIISDADRLLGRYWDPCRLDAWNDLVANSLFGRTGRSRAYRNWRRTEAS